MPVVVEEEEEEEEIDETTTGTTDDGRTITFGGNAIGTARRLDAEEIIMP